MKTLFIVLGTVLVLCICCEDGDDEKDTSGTGLDVREKTDITAPEDVGDATHSDGTGETAGDISTDLPDSAGPGLPYEMTRPDVGEPLTDAEITAFTKAITGFYKNAGFFGWLWWTGHGMHSSHDPDMPDYRLYWQDTQSFMSSTEIMMTLGWLDFSLLLTPDDDVMKQRIDNTILIRFISILFHFLLSSNRTGFYFSP